MTVAPYTADSVLPGGTATFGITVGTTGADAPGTTITISTTSTTDVAQPTFGTCTNVTSPEVCTVDLSAGDTQEILAGSLVQADAVPGAQVTLTAVVAQADATTSVEGSAVVTVAAPASTGTSGTGSSSTTGSGTSSSSSDLGDLGLTSPEGVIPNLPSFDLPGVSPSVIPGLPDGAFTTPANPSGLFPTVSPGSDKHSSRSKGTVHKATTDSAILPLSSRLIGGQLAGLAVLVAALAIAIVRLSLRRRPQSGGPADSTPNATPTA